MKSNITNFEPTGTDKQATWTSDNGNGAFTNPLLYDEFSDPDLIRVGDDFYMTGTTMHAMPGLPVLHSRDLVNWEFLTYAFETLDFGPQYHLEGGEIYGQGIWAPCLRYHNGTFYIFSNVNGQGTQVFTAADPAGPWKHGKLAGGFHDLSVLFDDDGKVYAIWNYDEVKMVELEPDLSGPKPGTERVIIPEGSGMGEGHHFYKIDGRYYIVSADYGPVGRMQCARADRPEGPYETVVISARETMGTQLGRWTGGLGPGETMTLSQPGENDFGCIPLHQGGIVDLPNGDWWGFSMGDAKSLGRMTFLSPVTWHDGWPYFGLPGNLTRSPRTWIKPNTEYKQSPAATYERSDDFNEPALKTIWQWNHIPDNTKWSLTVKQGALRLHTLPAENFFAARNSLTQRAIGPLSIVTTTLDAGGLMPGDVAGLALLNKPYAWLGIAHTDAGFVLRCYDELNNKTLEAPLNSPRVNLRAICDFIQETAYFSYSTDGQTFLSIGDEIGMGYQLKTFQGVRYTLFAFNETQKEGGYAEFESFHVDEPLADRTNNIPLGKVITLANFADNKPVVIARGLLHWCWPNSKEARSAAARFLVLDRGNGRVALQAEDGSGFITVAGIGASADVRLMKDEAGDASLFQWQDMLCNQFMLLSLKTHRYVSRLTDTGEPYAADSPGARPDRKDGSVFVWSEVGG